MTVCKHSTLLVALLCLTALQGARSEEGWLVETYAVANPRSGTYLAPHATEDGVFYSASADRIWEVNVLAGA